MGTLTSCSFLPLNSEFRSNPVRQAFREKIHCHQLNRLRGSSCFFSSTHVSNWGKWKKHVNFDRFRCLSNNYKNDKDGDDGEGKSGNDDSKSTPSSNSNRSSLSSLGSAYDSFQGDRFIFIKFAELEIVDPADVKLIKDKLFGFSTFWVTKEEPFGELREGIIFYGNLRGKREDVFSKLQSQLVEVTGDKYNLFMVEEPDSDSSDPRGGPRVSFILLRKEVSEPKPTALWQYVIASLMFFLTIGSSVVLGIEYQIYGFPPEVVKFFEHPGSNKAPDMELLISLIESALPFAYVVAYGIWGVLLLHEVGHFLAAFPKQVKLSIPFFFPDPAIGSIGTTTQFKSILPDRSTLVDISLAGPFAGAVLSFLIFAVGLLLSSNPDAAGDLMQVPSWFFQGSLLLGLIIRATLGYEAMHAATVSVHPLVLAGWCGLTIQAFNMLPVGSLDGGRAVQGAFGKIALLGFSFATYALLVFGVICRPYSLLWGSYVLLTQKALERPCLNDVKEVGTWRKTLLGVAIFLSVLTLLPVWGELGEELDLGLVAKF